MGGARSQPAAVKSLLIHRRRLHFGKAVLVLAPRNRRANNAQNRGDNDDDVERAHPCRRGRCFRAAPRPLSAPVQVDSYARACHQNRA